MISKTKKKRFLGTPNTFVEGEYAFLKLTKPLP
jgi:hypothetical protein